MSSGSYIGNNENGPYCWGIKYGSIKSDILLPLGLICQGGTFENYDLNQKNYIIELYRPNIPTDKISIKLTQTEFNKLLNVKEGTHFNFKRWHETLKRKEKLEQINEETGN